MKKYERLAKITNMRKVYDLDDYIALGEEGWKLPSNATLKQYRKDELVDIIRMLEHNWAGSIKQNILQQKRLKNFYNYYQQIGQGELFSKLMNEEILGDKENEI